MQGNYHVTSGCGDADYDIFCRIYLKPDNPLYCFDDICVLQVSILIKNNFWVQLLFNIFKFDFQLLKKDFITWYIKYFIQIG